MTVDIHPGKNCGVLLTVAGQLVIYTQFPINPEMIREPSPFDEEI